MRRQRQRQRQQTMDMVNYKDTVEATIKNGTIARASMIKGKGAHRKAMGKDEDTGRERQTARDRERSRERTW